ncbi:MAG TPA: pyruvate dehydrogenase (acetyl-transferring), homodimeric type, partial [Burkholderiaceae bacterium]|nr:pyruvate dehydrogenase (acetyl-transferring), homodimeric type [Burkholderiaceae bacterium]
ILKGMYLLQEGDKKAKQRVQLIGSGTILRESIFAAELLKNDWNIAADVWSAPSLTLVARDGQDCERWNLVNPGKEQRVPYATSCLQGTEGPIIATTDYMRAFAEQIRAFVPKNRTYRVLGTDGFGRSDSRAKLREFFEVNRYYITVAALKSLSEEGKIDVSVVEQAIAKYGIDANKPNPVTQ